MNDIIKAAAEVAAKRRPKHKEGVPFLCDSSDINMFKQLAFIEGATWAAEQQRIEREKAMKFAEWAGRVATLVNGDLYTINGTTGRQMN